MQDDYQRMLDNYRKQFADYTMTEHGAEPARIFHLRKPGWGGMEGVDIVFLGSDTVDRIVITGDLCPNDNQGCVSNVRYGLGWFARPQGGKYLCGRFLRETWVPECALAGLRDALAEQRRILAEDEPDANERRDVEKRIGALEEAIEAAALGDSDDPTRSAEAFSDWWCDTFNDGPEDTGYGYDPRDEALLVVIHETFVRLYAAHRRTTTEAA
jgi:hypothetical protein